MKAIAAQAAMKAVAAVAAEAATATTPSRQLPGLAAPFLHPAMSASVRAEIRPSPSLRIRAMLSPTSRLTARALARRSPTPLRMSAEPIPSRSSL